MAPKGGNSAKKESGRAKKAENEANRRREAAEANERKEAAKWEDGSKPNKFKEDKEEKRKAEILRKAENARLLEEEEAAALKKKASPKAGSKKAAKPAGPGAIAAAGAGAGAAESAEPPSSSKNGGEPEEIESFAATGIDNVLDLVDVVTAKMDKASVGNQAASTVEKHPERRVKAAFNAYVDRELPIIRAEQPGLRLQQYKDLLFKQFQRAPENPFNQTTVEYNATTEDKVDALRQKQDEIRERLREKS